LHQLFIKGSFFGNYMCEGNDFHARKMDKNKKKRRKKEACY